MGHMSHNALKYHGPTAVTGMDLDVSTSAELLKKVCQGCKFCKSTRKPFSGGCSKKTTRPFEVVHSDLCGPMQSESIQGSVYYASFVDDFSNHTVVYFLKSKDQFAQAFKLFLAWGKTQTESGLHVLHSDRGGEYLGSETQTLLKQNGIEHHLMMPGSPQQNGKAEWFNCTIMDKAMSMLHMAGMSKGFWECAIECAVHIYNCSPSHTLKWKTPLQIWSCGEAPNISHIHTSVKKVGVPACSGCSGAAGTRRNAYFFYRCVFGCKAFMHVPSDKHRKLDAKSIETTLVGYEPGSRGYKL